MDRDVSSTLAELEDVVRRLPSAPMTFAATLGALDDAWSRCADLDGRSSCLMSVHPDPDVRDAAQRARDRVEAFRVSLPFRPEVQQTISRYSNSEESGTLTGERLRALELWRRDLRRSGQGLTEAERQEIAVLRARLTRLEATFERAVNDHTDWIEVDRAGLAGLPSDYIERLQEGSAPGTWRVSLAYHELQPFVELADRRDLRETLLKKHWSRAPGNRELAREILAVRHEVATRLGYASHADYVLEVRMVGSRDSALDFLAAYEENLRGGLERELATIGDELERDGHGRNVAAWDWRYYRERRRRNQYAVDEMEVAQYLPVERVLDGLFEMTAKVFGLRFRRLDDAPGWDPAVVAMAMDDEATDAQLGTVYLDLHPRPGKDASIAQVVPMTPPRQRSDGSRVRPVAMLLMNLPPATETQPSLLRHSEMVTLFHEFGHVLHVLLGNVELGRLSLDGVELDFVEGPSQLFENWGWTPGVIGSIARHHETGAPLPRELIERLAAAEKLNAAIDRGMGLFSARFDQALHGPSQPPDFDREARAAFAATGLRPFMDGTSWESSFTHLFGHGYDAGYYGYLWSEVIGVDLWSRFVEAGIDSPAVGREFRERILAPNAARPAAELIRDFLGREPTMDAWVTWLAEGGEGPGARA